MGALILFVSNDGHTKKIASYISDNLKGEKCDVVNFRCSKTIDWEKYDSVILGASVRYGNFDTHFKKFVKDNLFKLNRVSSAFFSVSLNARKKNRKTIMTNSYVRKFLLETRWNPCHCAIFAGALKYPMYGYFDRLIIWCIMAMSGEKTNLSAEVVEYTDWEEVAHFAKQFSDLGTQF